MGTRVECAVCGRMIGKGPDGLGIRVHARTHREQFVDRHGRPPEDYAEVRAVLDGPDTEQARFHELSERLG